MNNLVVGTTVVVGGIAIVLLVGAGIGFASLRNIRGSKVLTENLAQPLNDAKTAKVDINAGSGNLTIDRLTSGEKLLANGTLQYPENKGKPVQTLNSSNGQATFTLSMGDAGQPRFRFTWEACNSELNWQIHLNPTVSTDIKAFSGGGNVTLDLTGMVVTSVSADTGGGNVDVVLPDHAANLNVIAKTGAGNVNIEIGETTGSSTIKASSGAGNVVVHIPSGFAAKIHITTGLGKAIMDPRFSKIDDSTYQSSDFDSAANKVELTLKSGAGNVSVDTK
jgi:hypothetical protein